MSLRSLSSSLADARSAGVALFSSVPTRQRNVPMSRRVGDNDRTRRLPDGADGEAAEQFQVSARPILDTLSTLIIEDTHLLILALSALTAAVVTLIVRRWQELVG